MNFAKCNPSCCSQNYFYDGANNPANLPIILVKLSNVFSLKLHEDTDVYCY